MSTAYHPHPRERRYAGLALTVLVHAALLLGWQMSRQAVPVDGAPEPARTRIQWIRLSAPAAPPVQPAKPVPLPKPAQATAPAPAHSAPLVTPRPATPPSASSAVQPITIVPAAPAADAPVNAPQSAPSEPMSATPGTAEILNRARRDIGKIDRTLRKENNPYIAAPLSSPQMRMREQMEAAHDMAAPRLWEAPKIEELVTNTGTGERRTRVITGGGTYCITDRPLNSSIDMIEKHGKQRITNCPEHETPASKQTWRTLRD
jgi:hypothetical protein